MKGLYVIFTVVALTTAQKPYKTGKHGKNAYVASSPGEGNYGQSQYESPAQYNSQHSQNQAKPTYSQLISDERTSDGGFNFQADNGLQQGETVDSDGTRRGFYSYPGADGKQITVKYTAGKHGFIAEGDHLPLQPQGAAHSDKDEQEYTPKQHKPRRQQEHDTGHYNPGAYSNGGSSSSRGYSKPAPAPYSQNTQRHGGGGGQRYQGYQGPSSYDGAGSSGAFSSQFDDFGGSSSQGFSSPQSSHYSSPARAPAARPYAGAARYPSPSYSTGGGGPSYGGAAKQGGAGYSTADNPYQPGPAGAHKYKVDLGNSGHYSINFAPGASQPYQSAGSSGSPSYSPANSPPVYGGAKPGGRRPNGPSRGQY